MLGCVQEREEEVKLEFIGAMTAFIRATLVADAGGAGSPSLTSRAVDMAYGGGVGAPPRLKRQTSNAAALEVSRGLGRCVCVGVCSECRLF